MIAGNQFPFDEQNRRRVIKILQRTGVSLRSLADHMTTIRLAPLQDRLYVDMIRCGSDRVDQLFAHSGDFAKGGFAGGQNGRRLAEMIQQRG